MIHDIPINGDKAHGLRRLHPKDIDEDRGIQGVQKTAKYLIGRGFWLDMNLFSHLLTEFEGELRSQMFVDQIQSG